MYARDKCRGINQANLISDNTHMQKKNQTKDNLK